MLIKNSDAAQARADATTNRARREDTANQPKYAGASRRWQWTAPHSLTSQRVERTVAREIGPARGG
jgi:hypothetical protein